MDDKQEGGSFVKQLQNKLKNLRKKLEKIEAKEKKPLAELSEDDKEQLRKKPVTEMMAQEYEKIYASFVNSKEGTVSVASAPVEVRTEVHFTDVAPSFLDLWLTLHHMGLPGSKETFLAAGGSPTDLAVVQSVRKAALGPPAVTVSDWLNQTKGVFSWYRSPSTESETDQQRALNRVKDWCMSQRVPDKPKELKVDRMREEHQIVKEEPKLEEKKAEEQPREEEVKLEPAQEVQPTPEAVPSSSWAHQDSDEEPAAAEPTPGSEDSGFVQVTGRTKRPKPAPEARSTGRPRRNGRRGRGGRGRGE